MIEDVNKSNDESSSEDEICRNNLKEATDDNFLKSSFFDKETKNANENISNSIGTSKLTAINNYREDQYKAHKLTEDHRNFIAKQLNANLAKCITLESKSMLTKDLADVSEINFFSISNTVAPKNCEINSLQKYFGGRKFKIKHRRKVNLEDYQDAAVNPRNILLQDDIKFWTNRKKHKIFKYEEKNGILKEVI